MSHAPALHPEALHIITAVLAEWTGFQPGVIDPEIIHRALQPLADAGLHPRQVMERVMARDRDLMARLVDGAAVGESYFFRQPEHFQWAVDQLVPAWVGAGKRQVAAWSAGCAHGEEAWSLAACLHDALAAHGCAVSVVGTDLAERHIRHGTAGCYGSWSVERAGARASLALEAGTDSSVYRVRSHLRSMVSFAVHNLLHPPPAEQAYDLVMCRNVLIYLSPEAAERVLRNLVDALAPGGVLLCAAVDLANPPPGLVRVGPPELQAFMKPGADRALSLDPPVYTHRPTRPFQPAPAEPPLANSAPSLPPAPPAIMDEDHDGAVALHIRALEAMEQGRVADAEHILEELSHRDAHYLPGLLEYALLCARMGKHAQALRTMKRVLRQATGLPSNQELPGPQPLPASFYATTAMAFLDLKMEHHS